MKSLMFSVFSLCALVLASAAIAADDDRPAELKVLDRWVGEFDSEMTIKPGKLVPTGSKTIFFVKARWVLNGRFVLAEGKGTRTQGEAKQAEEAIVITTWDKNKRQYRSKFFFAVQGGGADYWGGNFDVMGESSWDEKDKTMRVNAKDEATGNTIQGSTRWIDDDHYEWGNVVKDADGNVLMEQVGKGSRRKSK